MPTAKHSSERQGSEKLNEILAKFADSFKFDRRLFEADIRSNLAYCNALFHAGILTKLEAERIKNGLLTLLKRAKYNRNFFDEYEAEDVHSFIENKLVQLIGETARKLHIGRSRSDQMVTIFRLWLREEIETISQLTRWTQKTLVESAEQNKDAFLPGYNHLRRGQPILWSHWCLAYFEMLKRDRERLEEVWRRTNILPLGSGTFAGKNWEICREAIAEELGFEGITNNSLDAIGDRDFAVEFIGACSLLMMHLSRLAEDLLLYSSKELQLIEFSGSPATNSDFNTKSRNALELIRGKTGEIFGYQIALLTTLKGLSLAYTSAIQEDKKVVFETADTVESCLQVATLLIRSVRLNKDKMLKAISEGYLNASEFVNYLICKGMPFREARATVERLIFYAIKQGRCLQGLSLEEMQDFSHLIEGDVYKVITVEKSLADENQVGGASPERVVEALKAAREELEFEEKMQDKSKIDFDKALC